jgi:cytochrome b
MTKRADRVIFGVSPPPSDHAAMSSTPAEVPIRVWDLPTRAFHWILAASIVGSIVSAKVGGNAMVLHFRLGYLALALLLFRVLWGLFGGRWSRFAGFVRGPATVWRYLRGRHRPEEHLEVGHSPLAALSVLALLAVIGLQVGSGLVADDEIANVGPLNRYVSGALAAWMTGWHKSWGQWLLIALVALHLGAIAYHRFVRGRGLVVPMISGDKRLPPGVPASLDGRPQSLLALVLAALCVAVAAWIASLGS